MPLDTPNAFLEFADQYAMAEDRRVIMGQRLAQPCQVGRKVGEFAVVGVDDRGKLIELAAVPVNDADQLIELTGVLVEPAIALVKSAIVLIEPAHNCVEPAVMLVESAVMLVESAIMPGNDPSDFGQKLVDRRAGRDRRVRSFPPHLDILPSGRYPGGLCSKSSMSSGRGFQLGLLGHSFVRPDISSP